MTTAERMSVPLWNSGKPNLGFLVLAVAVIGALGLYAEALVNLWSRWGEQEELSHSYFIPVISAWLVWVNRARVRASIGAPSAAGIAFIFFALAVFILGRVTSNFLFQHISFVILIAGFIATYGGLSLLRAVAAPVAFLLFAVPPPYWMINVLSWNFQEWSSILGAKMIELMGIPVYVSGNIIDLGEYKLNVAEACSGLRYLFPFLSIGVMAGYMYRGPLWHRAVIILSTIPITILMNSFRIAVTGAFVQAYGPEHAEGALHFFEGWVVFLFCLAALFAVVFLLTRFGKNKLSPIDALATPELPQVTPSRGRFGLVPLAGVTIALLGSFFLIAETVTVDTLIAPERQRFASIPARFSDWNTTVRPMSAEVAAVLRADDSIVVDMISPEKESFNLYIAYLEARRDNRSWHSPRQCIPGGGWKITQHDILDHETPAGQTINYNRLVIENGGARQLVYYWYDQRGRKIANEFVMKFWLIHDAITRQRGDGAMIRVMTPAPTSESIGEADARLVEYLNKVAAIAPDYIPE